MTTKKQHDSAVRLAKKSLAAALKAKQQTDDSLAKAKAAIEAADGVSTIAQKRHANTQGELNRVMGDPKSTVEEIKELRKTLKESVVQQGDASDSINAKKQDLKQAGRAVVEAGDNVVEVEAAYWRSVWLQAAAEAREAADKHLRVAWAAGLACDFEPGQFGSMLNRTFSEYDESESRALAETLR